MTMTQSEAYDKVCEIAREHALILSAAGGIVTIVHPDTQKEQGVYDKIQLMHKQEEY